MFFTGDPWGHNGPAFSSVPCFFFSFPEISPGLPRKCFHTGTYTSYVPVSASHCDHFIHSFQGFCFVFELVGIKPKGLHMTGKYSTSGLYRHAQPSFYFSGEEDALERWVHSGLQFEGTVYQVREVTVVGASGSWLCYIQDPSSGKALFKN